MIGYLTLSIAKNGVVKFINIDMRSWVTIKKGEGNPELIGQWVLEYTVCKGCS